MVVVWAWQDFGSALTSPWFLGLTAAAGSFRAGAAIAQIDQPRIPPLAGEFEQVGVRYVRCGGARVKVFYPASATSAEAAPYCTDGRTTSDGMAGLVAFRQLGLSFLLGHLADARSGCWLDAPPAGENLPLLVYSHGFGGNMDMASYLFRTFAAHGIVVAAVEHTDGTASYTQLADESPFPFAPLKLKRKQQLERRAEELLATAQPGALDGLPTGDVFLGGHSFGGPAALLAAASASTSTKPPVHVRGLLLHDPALGMGALARHSLARMHAHALSCRRADACTALALRPRAGADVWAVRRGARGLPTLSYVSDEYDRFGVRCGDATLHTVGGFHGNFVDAPLWAPNWVMAPLSFVIPASGPCDAVAMHEMLARTAAIFMRATSDGAAAVPTDDIIAASAPQADGRRMLELRTGQTS